MHVSEMGEVKTLPTEKMIKKQNIGEVKIHM
jgi:hypothetical protein